MTLTSNEYWLVANCTSRPRRYIFMKQGPASFSGVVWSMYMFDDHRNLWFPGDASIHNHSIKRIKLCQLSQLWLTWQSSLHFCVEFKNKSTVNLILHWFSCLFIEQFIPLHLLCFSQQFPFLYRHNFDIREWRIVLQKTVITSFFFIFLQDDVSCKSLVLLYLLEIDPKTQQITQHECLLDWKVTPSMG